MPCDEHLQGQANDERTLAVIRPINVIVLAIIRPINVIVHNDFTTENMLKYAA